MAFGTVVIVMLLSGCSGSEGDSVAGTPFCSLLASYPSFRLDGIDLIAYSEVQLSTEAIETVASDIRSIDGVSRLDTLTPRESVDEYQRVMGGPLSGATEAPTQPFPATFYVVLEAEATATDTIELLDKISSIENVQEVNFAIDWPPADSRGERAAALDDIVPDDLRADLDTINAAYSASEERLLEVQAAASRIRDACTDA